MSTAERRADTILIVGSYDREEAAGEALGAILALVEEGSVDVHGATVVHRGRDGKISVEGGPDGGSGHGAGWGALAGVAVAVLFPPSLLAGGLVGGGIGMAVGFKHSRRTRALADAIANTLPPGSSGVIAIAPAAQIDALDRVLAGSGRVTKSGVDDALVNELRTRADAS